MKIVVGRCNLIFFGIDGDDAREPYAKCEERVVNLWTSVLQVEYVEIERAHRLGKFDTDKQRPIIAKFRTFKDKQEVLLEAKKLKGISISISEDFSEPVLKRRKMLLEYAKAHETEADKVYVKRDVLYLHKIKYVYDDSLGQVVRAA